ncbi:MAG TPA: branched-chain amino acid ABC transporter permease [Candidatus Limnocylindrales bacterium]|nr:branched-chain amino acid ABC transporter permease [Candidatus Limnocylindrales bacterium]
MFSQQLVNAISLGGVYALFALGFTLVFGVLNVVNLAHGAIFMLGSYAALQAVLLFRVPLLAALMFAMLVTAVAGWLLDKMIFAPLRARQAPHLAPMIATIGLAIALNSTVQGLFGAENLRFPAETLPANVLSFGAIQITQLEIQIIFLALVLMAVLLWGLKQTRVGWALRGLAESPKAAALLGVNVEGYFRATAVVASSLGGVAGVLIALYSNAVFPSMGQPMLHKGIAVVILGGMGDVRGALLGGFFLGFAEVFSVAYIGSTMRDAVAFGLLFAILLLRPQGLFGQAAQRRA